MTIRLIAIALLSGLAMNSATAQERADAFPSRAIKIVVPFPAGGPSDVLARMIGQKMSEDFVPMTSAEVEMLVNTLGGTPVEATDYIAKMLRGQGLQVDSAK